MMVSQAKGKGTTNPEELSDRNNNIYSNTPGFHLLFSGGKHLGWFSQV